MCANKKIQDISMKAATGNHQILGLPIVSQRPKADHRNCQVNGLPISKAASHNDKPSRLVG